MNRTHNGKGPILLLSITLIGFSLFVRSFLIQAKTVLASEFTPNQLAQSRTNTLVRNHYVRTAAQLPAPEVITYRSSIPLSSQPSTQQALEKTRAGRPSQYQVISEPRAPIPTETVVLQAPSILPTPVTAAAQSPALQSSSSLEAAAPVVTTIPLYAAPATGAPGAAASLGLPSLKDFIQQVAGGQGNDLVGLYADGILALRIVNQPAGDPAFIDQQDGTATRFQSADAFGGIGLLAHNFLSGRDFFKIKNDNELRLIYSNGSVRRFRVHEIADFQRLSLADLRSDFLELSTQKTWSADQVFAHFYQTSGRLTLQTCIERNGMWSWGVRFITADPLQ